MNGSWHLGKLAGIDVRIHWSFLLLPLWVYFSSLLAGSGLAVAIASVIFVLAIFGCVVLHELGHALAARKYGIATEDITLLPIGGLARLERMPRNPYQELAIAVAGPAVNVVIAAALFVGLALAGSAVSTSAVLQFLTQLAWVNVGLVIFNLIPAFPMDGGRVLRSVLAMFLPYQNATQVAAGVGQIAAVGFGILGLFAGNPMLVLIAVFIFFAARGESSQANRALFRHHQEESGPGLFNQPPGQTDAGPDSYLINESSQPSLDGNLTAEQAARWVVSQPGENFPVHEGHSIIGAITRSDLLHAIVAGGGALPVKRLMSMRFVNRSSSRFASFL